MKFYFTSLRWMSWKYLLLVVIAGGVIGTTAFAIKELQQYRQSVSEENISKGYASLLDDELVWIEADLLRNSLSPDSLMDAAEKLSEQQAWLKSLHVRDSQGAVVWSKDFQQLSAPTQDSDLNSYWAMPLLETAMVIKRMQFVLLPSGDNRTAMIYVVWPIADQQSFGFASLSLQSLLDEANKKSTGLLGVRGKMPLVSQEAAVRDSTFKSTIRINSGSLQIPILLEPISNSVLPHIFWQDVAIPVLLLAMFFAIYSVIKETRRRQAIELFFESQQEKFQMQTHLAHLGEISALISHEINGPLSVIENYASAGSNALTQETESNDILRKSIHGVLTQVDRVSKIIKSVQSLGNTSQTELHPIEAVTVLHELLPLIQLAASRLKVKVILNDHAPIWINSNQSMLEQILINLSKNATESMESTPLEDRILDIEISIFENPSLKRAQNASAQDYLRIKLSDNGCGVPQHIQKNLFEVVASSKTNGHGFGLILCKRFIDRLHGNLVYRGKPEGGSVFIIELPLFVPVSPMDKALSSNEPSDAGLR